jgi:hypothetical protein
MRLNETVQTILSALEADWYRANHPSATLALGTPVWP